MIGQHSGRQGGYSLVEIGIVLVAASFVVTGSIWAFSESFRTEQHKGTAEYMQAVHTAILAYANTHRTPGIEVVFTDRRSPPHTAQIEIPAGRPVLPCPDLNGDGLEDRNQVLHGNPPVTIRYTRPGSNRRTAVVLLNNVPGRCMDDKGNIPWRTLGTQPFDHWGQIYSYWVDHNFTHGIFGFDQTTRGNSVFKHMVLRMEDSTFFTYPLSNYSILHAVSRDNGGAYTNTPSLGSRRAAARNGVIVADSFLSLPSPSGTAQLETGFALVAGDFFLSNPEYYRRMTEKRLLNHPDGPEVNVYEFRGIQVESNRNTIFLDQRLRRSQQVEVIADGIAFALISHGPNGLGGVTYDSNYPNSAGTFTCKTFRSFTDSDYVTEHQTEILNARRTYPCEEGNLFPNNCVVGNDRTLISSCARRRASNGIIFTGPRTTAVSTRTFDDIVTWMHPRELMTALTEQGILPVSVPPVADPGAIWLVDPLVFEL